MRPFIAAGGGERRDESECVGNRRERAAVVRSVTMLYEFGRMLGIVGGAVSLGAKPRRLRPNAVLIGTQPRPHLFSM